MKAVVVNKPGDSSVLELVDRPMPVADATHSVMKIKAFGVHRYEVLTREGGSPSVQFPRVIGVEAVGEIAATDPASALTVGQRVITLNGGFGREFDGSNQEYALVPNEQLYSVQYQGSWVDLAQYPETFVTAWGSIKSLRLQPGQTMLVRGGTSAVGLAMIQLAHAIGLNIVATTRKSERVAQLKALGADEVVLDVDSQLQTDQQIDGIVDLVGTATVKDSMQHLQVGGTCCVVGLLAGEWIMPDFSPFELQNRYLTDYDSGFVDQALIDELFTLINRDHLEIPITKVFKLTELAAAHDFVMRNPAMGEVIVTTD
ncbi:zinc-binding dehydrogenase [Lactiplantibacillus mudanjiangensis]|uniref:Acryloyl-coenzyme A reductase [Lactobacillus brevis KB290] n=1 Tax=Lactiplantibacillus mudanjiangensis TaxID=1296538 RepID=A0A660DZR4_9LACO|nr:zinc-binding dehydrogenase [Lactiplantibacillus mudanjiangensis]VDG18604.1 Acryloyl-coenzyme A reductase [Lactobacillus brevis KB290] [Lactiplantibacillus mudanjiangensis]VDG25885.1 Acryloyl-coenzyme A reductase [Lactobacillus brevis KB290] [Lactiplantibacillus mudanjiangensis]VDG28683.1 Acryloyl-coenzyme A reductase [Lactobacillus brevis KB290] [Lactiplantibacillus mudanjiangensis]VDG33718.1 Acryloyl-coenzyme A reductase [Lactobacillus brevis KB290] [Lactiplantibacillus mudanjiangensis]